MDKKFTLIIVIIEALLAFIVGYMLFQVEKNDMKQEVINTIAEYFDEVDKDLSYEQALKSIYEESQTKSRLINQLETENEQLKTELETMQELVSLDETASTNTDLAQPYSYYAMIKEDSPYYIDGMTAKYYQWKNSCYDTEKTLRENIIYYRFDEASTKIFLDGKFKKATGTFFYFLEQLENGRSGSLEVYGDAKLLYDKMIDASTSPDDFDIDLTGVIYLTVKMRTGSSSTTELDTTGKGFAGISNFNLYT